MFFLRKEPAAGQKTHRRSHGVYICDECIELCNEIIDEEFSSPEVLTDDDLPKPREINRILNEYVIGQEDAKKVPLRGPSTTTTSASRWYRSPAKEPSSRSRTFY